MRGVLTELLGYCRRALDIVAAATRSKVDAETELEVVRKRNADLLEVDTLGQCSSALHQMLENSPVDELREAVARKDDLIRTLRQRAKTAVATVQMKLDSMEREQESNLGAAQSLSRENNRL
eukprot:Sspe_Gene.48794::Locus_25714_Transcript_1_3_Confidence_0.571_Length_364::g.48794::m.48794